MKMSTYYLYKQHDVYILFLTTDNYIQCPFAYHSYISIIFE